jgi:hypothetical protein
VSEGAPGAAPGAGDLRGRLAAAVEGLLYSSESDRPFAVWFRPAAEVPRELDAARFAALVGAAGEAAEERDFGRFLTRHIDCVDPADAVSWQKLPRYEALQALLEAELSDLRFFRVGRVQVRCYAVGRDEAGNLVGLETVAVET